MPLEDRAGRPLQQRKGEVTYREVERIVHSGGGLIVNTTLRPYWQDAKRWWAAHRDQVETHDHPAKGPWPEHAAYPASIWFSADGWVVVVDEAC